MVYRQEIEHTTLWPLNCDCNLGEQDIRYSVLDQPGSVSGDRLQPTTDPLTGTVYRKKTVLATI